MTITLNGSTGITTPGIDWLGNLTFTGTANRIYGDFSNATIANRVAFQTTTANTTTSLGVIPSGTGQASAVNVFSSSDPDNASYLQIRAGTDIGSARIFSGISGSGSYLPLTFWTGNAQRMHLDTSGNLGLGVTPSAWGASYKALELTYGAFAGTSTNFALFANAYFDGTNSIYKTSSLASQYAQIAGQHRWYNAPSGTAGGTITWTQAMTLDASGNLGVGTDTPTARLSARIPAATSTNTLVISATDGTYCDINFFLNRQTTLATSISEINTSAGIMTFATSSTERARITAAGEVYIAGTTDRGAYNLQCNGTGVWGAGAYVNGSDERIKDDITPLASSLDVVNKLNPVTYRYKEDWSKDQSIQTGFIAQELLTVFEGKNYVDGIVQQGGADGYYSVAYQNIIPILTKAIQELKAELDATKAEVAALKGAQ